MENQTPANSTAAPDPDALASQDFRLKLSLLPAASSPWTSITTLIIAANVAAFVIMGFMGAGWFTTADMSPYVLYVANNAGATTDGEWWRVLTCMFVHYGALHLLLNMWALHQIGRFVEKLLGRTLFAVGYLGGGIIASFTTLFWHGDKVWSAGASGAVFGVYGLLLGFMLREKQSIPQPVLRPMMKSTLTFAGYNLVYGMILPQIDNAAHVGGLLGGIALGWLAALPLDNEVRAKLEASRLRWLCGAIMLATLAGIAGAPRFDYRFREELGWEKASQASMAREPEILLREQTEMAALKAGKTSADLGHWLEATAIPFYEDWLGQLKAMPLTPGKLTAQRRDRIANVLAQKIADYRQLIVSLQAQPSETGAPGRPGR